MLTLLKKEINAFLNSVIGYVVLVVFLVVNGLFLWVFPLDFNILDFGYANLDGLFMLAPFVFLFLIPAITMRSFADERSYGTIETLFTKPLTDLHIILAKYFAAVLLVTFSLLPTLFYYFTVYQLGLPKGNLDSGAIWGSYVGLLFLGASFAAIGIFASSLTDNQIVAFIAGAGIAAFVYLGFELIYSLSFFGKADLFIKSLGISSHYASMSRGVIDTRDIIYFLSVIAFFILLTHFILGRRKWK